MRAKILRLCSACLLMAMILTLCVSAVFSLEQTEEKPSALCLHPDTSPSRGCVEICASGDGKIRPIRYSLYKNGFETAKTLYGAQKGRLWSLSFENLPYGEYTLFRDGKFCCRFTLSPRQPRIVLSIV